MAEFASTLNSIEKFNAMNHEARECNITFSGSNTTASTNVEATKRQKVKAGKVMYALTVTTEDEFLQHIKNDKTPQEDWETLTMIFTKKNDATLQRLENELLSISQWNTTIRLYFSKVKSETRMRKSLFMV